MTKKPDTSSCLVVAIVSLLAACSNDKTPAEPPPSEMTADSGITIMTFNVENLFDNIDDPGKDDATYLPVSEKKDAQHIAGCNAIEVERWRDECLNLDWNDDVIDAKLRALAKTIQQVPGGPDIIAFQEVENEEILNRLTTDYLGEHSYGPAVLIEGQDVRGIDVAFLSKLPLAEPAKLHPLEMTEFPGRAGDTRGVLEATFELPDGSQLTGFAVHFPAPFHPTGMRVAAYRHLLELRNALPDDRPAFAAGDFNTSSSEAEQTGLLERLARPHWQIAHEVALSESCEPCLGTQYYLRGDSWSFLDMILFSPSRGEKATWKIRANSVRVANRTEAQLTELGRPRRFDSDSQTGVSDHWPLLMIIEPTQKQ